MTHPHPEKRKKDKLVFGVGINDAKFPISYVDHEGERRLLDSYRCWRGMLGRCYSEKNHRDHPTYVGCTVCDEWLSYTAFLQWHERQPRNDGDHLDKDLLIPGNRVYRPSACAFVSPQLNTFIGDRAAARGKYMIGASWHKTEKVFFARCNNPFTGKVDHIGRFDSDMEAHLAWKARKHELACQYAETVADPRVAAALKVRYLGEIENAA